MTREQFTSYVEGTQRAFRRFLVALCCGDTGLADDIAQEAYIKAFLSCESMREPVKFKSRIFRIGYTTFINHKRSEKQFAGYEEVRDMTSGDATDASFRYQALYGALNRLPDKERMSVLLFYMEGYSIKEIAAIQELTQDAVKQHLFRGRNHLRGMLSPQ